MATPINTPDYKVKIDAWALRKFNTILFSKYAQEFTAFSYCERQGDEFYIHELFFPKQYNSSVKTEIESEDFIQLKLKDGADLTKIKGHWHSHVNMGVSPSGTDEDEILERAELSGYNVALILNKRGDIFCHVADFDKNIYAEIEDYEIVYPFEKEEFESFVMDEAQKAENIQELKEIISLTEWDYFEEFYELSLEEEDFLLEVVEERFLPLYKTGYKNNTKSLGTYQKEKEWWEQDEYALEKFDSDYPLDTDIFYAR